MSLLAWLPFNGTVENKGLSDFEVTGTPSYLTGKLGGQASSLSKKLSFTIPGMQNVTEFSISFWCIINADDTLTSDWVDILGMNAKSEDETKSVIFRFETCYGSNKTTVGIGGYDGGSGSVIGNANAGTITVDKGKWFHVCATCNPTQNIVTWYLNGEVIVTKTYNGGHLTGEGYVGEANKVNGAIQDVKIYDNCLSKREVKELAKGLTLHVPLDWGGNPNMIKNSYTWMNGNLGTTNAASATMVVTKSVINSDTAPCAKVFHVQGVNSSDSASVGSVGPFFTIGNKGLTTDDLVSGETYTYSFWVRLVQGSTGTITLSANGVCESQTMVSNSGFTALTTDWRKHTVTFRWTSTTKLTNCFYASYPANSTVIWEVCGLKLEKSSVATPYLPHVEEEAYNNGYATLPFEDVSGYNRNGTNVGCTNGGSGPKGFSCIHQEAANQVNLTCLYSKGTEIPEFTASIWCKTTSSTGSPNLWCLGQNNFCRIRLTANQTNQIYYYIKMTSSTAKNKTVTVNSTTDGNWHLYTLTFKNGIVKIYEDGTLYDTADYSSTSSSLYMNGDVWYLGCYQPSSETLTGDLCDFRFYTTCLSDDDVKKLYNTSAEIDKFGNMYCDTFVEA